MGERGRSTSGFQHKCAARPSTRYPKIGTAIPTGPLLGVPPKGGMSVSSGGKRIPSVCGRGRALMLRPESNSTFDLGPDMLIEGQKRP